VGADYEPIRREAMGWLRRAGAIACERFGASTSWAKEDRSPVTDADIAVQEALLADIARVFPHDAVIAEETQSAPQEHAAVGSADRCWVIDPIDGTRNYERSIPVFTIALALMEGGCPVVGLVYNPMTDRMYSGTAGRGAWLNDEPLVAAESPDPDRICISIPTSAHEELPAVVHRWIDSMVVRNLGSTALHLALLATGSFDAVYCRKSKLWDIAA